MLTVGRGGNENARLENAAPNCRVGKRENGKRGTKTAGMENTGKGVYGQPNVTVYVVVQI